MPSDRRRPSWDAYFLQQLYPLAARATCDRGRSAAIFVKDHDQVAAGYVGSPPGLPHCDDVGHLWDETGTHCLRTIHAEQNAMIRALRHGISLRDTTVYCTMEPCFTCAKLMVGVGVYRVVATNAYHGAESTRELFADAQVALVVTNDEELYDPRGDNTGRPDKIDRRNDDLVCPAHKVPFSLIERQPNGRRLCPQGDTYVVGRSGVMVNVDELEWGERENL